MSLSTKKRKSDFQFNSNQQYRLEADVIKLKTKLLKQIYTKHIKN